MSGGEQCDGVVSGSVEGEWVSLGVVADVVVDGYVVFFLMIRRPPRSTQSRSSAASDVYKRQVLERFLSVARHADLLVCHNVDFDLSMLCIDMYRLSLIHISEPTRPY